MPENLEEYKQYLELEEKSPATVQKYLRDCRTFFAYLEHRCISKEETICYKEYLSDHYAVSSGQSMRISLNGFLRFIGMPDCCVKLMKVQRQIFCREEKELSKEEYKRLVNAAKGTRLSLVIQTICGTGIRVSELQYITVKAVRDGKAVVNCKNKTRVIFIPVSIQQLLKKYIKGIGITSGPVFISRTGRPLHRSNIWRDMKALCSKADVPPQKGFSAQSQAFICPDVLPH